VVQDEDVRPQEVSGSALLLYLWRWCTVGGILGVSGSMEREVLSVVSVCPRILSNVFVVYCLLLGIYYCVVYCVLCFHVC